MAVKSPTKIARIKKWLKALRSGKYSRTTGVLRRTRKDETVVGHCCLGVLCDIVDPKAWAKNGTHTGSSYTGSGRSVEMISATLLDSVGLDGDMGHKLAGMNDSRKYNFGQIADKISEMTGVKG